MKTENELARVELGDADEVVPGHIGIDDLHFDRQIDADAKSDGFVAGVRKTFAGYRDLRKTPYGLGPALIFGFIGFFQVFDTRAFSVAAPELVRELGINVQSIIDLITLIGVITAFAAIGAGWYADRHRRVPFFAIGTIGSGLFSMISSRATSTLSLGLPRVADDVSNSAADVPSFSLLADYYPPEARGRVFALLGSFSRAGALLSTATVGFMITKLGFRTTFLIVGAPLVVMGIIALVRLREPVRGYFERRTAGASEDVAGTEDEPQSLGEAWRTVWSVRTVRRFTIASVFFGFEAAVTGIFFGFFLLEEYGYDAAQRSLIGLPSVVAALLAGIYGGGLIDRFTVKNPVQIFRVYALFPLFGIIGTVGLVFRPPIVILIVLGMISGAGGALVGPAVNAVYSQVIPPSIRTQGLQMTGLAVLPGSVIGLQIGSRLFSEYGYSTVFLFGVPFTIIGSLIALTAGGFFDLDRRNAIAATVAAEEHRQAKAAGDTKLLVCRDVDVSYDGVQVLFGVDMDVHEGELIALLGTNGAGKSTLLRAISGSQEASAGAIVFDGRDITHMPPHEIAGRNVVHMPGGRGVFPGLSVRENLLLGNWINSDDEPDAIRQRLDEVFEIFPILRERADTNANALSGGEQQQLSLAQAFLMKPKLLMIDELSLGLAPAVVGQLLEIVKAIHARGVTIIVVEQSVNVALNLAEKAIFMEKGEIKFFGDTKDLLQRPDILRAVYVKGTGAMTEGMSASARRSERDRRQAELGEARPILEVANIEKRYGGVKALDDVSLSLREGEVLGLIGPNGSGKTTMFDIISGFQVPDAGTVSYEGVDITSMSPEERARKKLIRRFQDARLFPSLTVFETILISLEQQLEMKSSLVNATGLPQARRAERRLRVKADRLIELLELGAYSDKFVKELSTGLRRIVDLACVLAAEPRLLLLDEPSSGIAQAEAEGLGPLLRRIRFETGCSILIIEHDMPLISSVSDELVALAAGQVLLRGAPDAVLNDERVVESYLGGSEAAIQRSGSL